MSTNNSYTLQTDILPCGTITVKLHSPLSGLIVPSFNSLLYEETVERYDSIPGTIELEEMTCQFNEDYSVYAEGFWHKVLSDVCELQFYLTDENGALHHFFWGRVVGPVTEVNELAIVGNEFVRGGEFQLVSILIKAKETNVQTMLSLIENQLVEESSFPSPSGNNEYSYYHSLRTLFASILAASFNQTYDENDVIAPALDLEFYNISGQQITDELNGVYLYYGEGINGQPGFSVRDGFPWALNFNTCWDALQMIANSLFLTVRHTYNVATSRHQFQLLTRGRSYSENTYPVPLESQLIYMAYPTMSAGQSSREPGSFDRRYVYDSFGSPTFGTGDPPDLIDIEFNVKYLFVLRSTEETYTSTLRTVYLFAPNSAGYMSRFGYSKFWNYTTSAFTDEDYAALKYFYNRFKNAKRAYLRTYPGLTPQGGTIADNHVLRTTQISDGVSTRTFYAVEVTKNVYKDETKILWHER